MKSTIHCICRLQSSNLKRVTSTARPFCTSLSSSYYELSYFFKALNEPSTVHCAILNCEFGLIEYIFCKVLQELQQLTNS